MHDDVKYDALICVMILNVMMVLYLLCGNLMIIYILYTWKNWLTHFPSIMPIVRFLHLPKHFRCNFNSCKRVRSNLNGCTNTTVERTVHEETVRSTNTEQYEYRTVHEKTFVTLLIKQWSVYPMRTIIANKYHYQQSLVTSIITNNHHYPQSIITNNSTMEDIYIWKEIENIGLRATVLFLLIIIDTPVTRQLCVTSHYCCLWCYDKSISSSSLSSS